METNFVKDFLVKEDKKFNLKDFDTDYKGKLTKEEGEELLQNEKDKLYKLQEKLYADGSKSLLVVLQAMDAAGKDSLIEHVFGGVNPVSYTHLDVYKRQGVRRSVVWCRMKILVF